MHFLTINQTPRDVKVSRYYLRTMQKQGKLPGFYAGSRFYVNVDMLREMLEDECRANAEKSEETRAQ